MFRKLALVLGILSVCTFFIAGQQQTLSPQKPDTDMPAPQEETPDVVKEKESPGFKEEIELGNIYFPRNFIHADKNYDKGVYHLKLIAKEGEDLPYFLVYTPEKRLLFEELALVIPRKGKSGKSKPIVKHRLLKGNEYFMIKVIRPGMYVYAFFVLKAKK